MRKSMLLCTLSLIAILCSCGESAEKQNNGHQVSGVADVQPSPQSKYDDPAKQLAWIDLGKETIRGKLRDPDGAVFRNEQFYAGGAAPVVCGEVNAKNGFGGMTGFQRFFAAGDQMAVLESEMAEGEMQKTWDEVCR